MNRALSGAIKWLEGKDERAFAADANLYDACLYRIIIVAEAANDLPAYLLARYPEVEWSDLVGMGNRLKHQYYRVETAIAWQTLTVDFPVLLEVVNRMIEEVRSTTMVAAE